MADERFPRRRIQRQIRQLAWQLRSWRAGYTEAGADTGNALMAGKYAARAAVLELTIDLLEQAEDHLHEWPRLK